MTAPLLPPTSADELPLVRSRSVGDFRLHVIEAGLQRLDGGAMFGVVPKPLWERRIPADDRNRITLGLRCLLVETPDQLVLIETGLGNKEDEKFIGIYGIENAAPADAPGADRLQAAIRHLGFSLDQVETVINTHLHFDHSGGNTYRGEDEQIRISFPRASYYVQRGEWEFAHNTSERTRVSYIPYNYDPVAESGRFELLDGPGEVLPGISVVPTPGHTPHHQSVLLTSGGQTVCFMGDLVPTMAHLPLPWIMGYDVEPLVTLESKRSLLKRAVEGDWIVVSVHDAVHPWGRVRSDGKALELEPLVE